MSAASDITRRSKSNLAFALRILPPDRREDMVVFYAFCRTMDDLADDPNSPPQRKTEALESWKQGLVSGFGNPDDLQRQIVGTRDRRSIPNDLLLAIIDGCMMDIEPRRFQTWDDLAGYIWKVACAVGLVSVKLFGCTDPAADHYAESLGRALQLTNILRDIHEDLGNGGRIYLPMEDLARFGLCESDFLERKHDERFLKLMAFEADRAEAFFREAQSALPDSDRRALAPARIMAEIYHVLLRRMRNDGFRVFDKRYRVSKLRKLAILTKHLIAG